MAHDIEVPTSAVDRTLGGESLLSLEYFIRWSDTLD